MRLFLISIGTLGIALIIGLIIRFWGLSLPYKKFEHPFLDAAKTQTQPLVIPVLNKEKFNLVAHTQDSGFTFEAKPEVAGRKMIWVNIYITSDRELVCDYDVNIDEVMNSLSRDGKHKGKFIHLYTKQELAPYTKLIPLTSVLTSFPTHHFIFNVLSNEINIQKDIIKFIDDNQLSDKVLVTSPVDVVIKSIKDSKPMWAYGTSIPEAARLKSFATLGLESAISIRGDVFIAPVSYLKRPMIDESLVSEMKRRKKLVFIGPLNNQDERKSADELNPDGIVF